MFRSLTKMTVLSLVCFACALSSTQVKAQDTPEAREAAHKELESTLDQINGLFYKRTENDNGKTFYTVIWEREGKITKIFLEIRYTGYYAQKPVYGLYMYSKVAEQDGAFPPAVIKYVTSRNDRIVFCYLSMTEEFNAIYANQYVPSANLEAGQIWMMMLYMHDYRLEATEKVDELMAAYSR